MNDFNEQNEEYATDNTTELLRSPTQKTLKSFELLNQDADNLLDYVYDQWDSYDILSQQSLPQAEYEKAMRLISLSRNTLEKFLDQFAELDTTTLTDVQLREMIKRCRHTMRALRNYFNKAGISEMPRAA